MLQYTEHDYLRWENARSEKFELHHGFVVAFAGGTIEHNQIALRMRDILKVLFAEPRLVFTSEIKVKRRRPICSSTRMSASSAKPSI